MINCPFCHAELPPDHELNLKLQKIQKKLLLVTKKLNKNAKRKVSRI